MQRRFDERIVKSKTFASTPSDEAMLQLYALFKQGTAGPEAMQRCIELVGSLLHKT